jgi:arsenite-transporting ATPase
MSKLSLFIGKGGVGKTTLSAAYAVHQARRQRGKTILISTDPAHSLADIFEIKLGQEPRAIAISNFSKLLLWQIDAEKQLRGFIDRHRASILDLVESGTIFSRQEIEPLLDATLPGMAEFAALLAIRDLAASKRYSDIVVDTAPLGHTLRLFQMPEQFARFLHFLDVAASRDRVLAECFAGATLESQPLLDELGKVVIELQQAFSADHASITLVTTPETFALNESVRAKEALSRSAPALAFNRLILNRAVIRAGNCPRCRSRAAETRDARAFLAKHFQGMPVLYTEDIGGPIVGVDDLQRLAAHVFERRKLVLGHSPAGVPNLKFRRQSWPDLTVPLSLTVGKGGVGKTTISAGLACHQRQTRRKTEVTICSTDPAPSLDDIFQQPVGDDAVNVLGAPGLRAMEVDSIREFQQWTQRMKIRVDRAFSADVRGVHVDLSFERQLIAALLDIVPPGVDELLGVFRILELAKNKGMLVIDMAPTGHALELLRTPERLAQWSRLLLKTLAPHRTLPLAQDAAVEIAAMGQRVRELLSMLHDQHRAQVWPVMLAETLPDRETGRLLQQLRQMGIHTARILVNRVIFREDAAGCPRCRRAHVWQMATLAALRRRIPKVYVVRDFGHEIAGARTLKAFTKSLWEVA